MCVSMNIVLHYNYWRALLTEQFKEFISFESYSL